MATDPSIKLFMQQVHLKADARYQEQRWKWWRSLPLRESLASSVLGAAALAASAAVLAVTILAILNVSGTPWTTTLQIVKEGPNQFGVSDGKVTVRPMVISIGEISVPTLPCRVLTLCGAVAGIAGLAVGWRQGRLSWISTVGVSVILFSVLIEAARQVYLSVR